MASSPFLVTGFGPFLNVTLNPSGVAACRSGMPFVELEVSYGAALTFVRSLATNPPPQALLLGIKRQGEHYQFETVARNARGGTPDSQGESDPGRLIEDAPDTLPHSLWPDSWTPNPPLEGKWSEDAGGYLCNALFFYARHYWPDSRVGFLHLPSLEAIPLEQQVIDVRRIINLLSSE